MKSVIPFAKAGLPTVAALQSGFQTAVAEKPQIGGLPLLRLVDGAWVYGPENVEVEEGSRWAINPASFEHGYCAWLDGTMVGEVMMPIGQPRPMQSDLPACGAKWQEQTSFVLACIKGEDTGVQVLFKTSSLGGRDAWSATAQRILNQMSTDAEKIVPIVELKSGGYKHKKYGFVHTPDFSITGWASLEAGTAEEVQEAAKEEEKPKTRTRRKV